MTILANIPNGASNKDIRDTLNSVIARVLALEGGVATPTPTPTPSNATLSSKTVTIADSWFAAGNPLYAGYYAGAYFAAHPEHAVQNLAMGGQGLDYFRSRVNEIIALNPYVISISFGRNDFMNDSSGQGYTDAEVYAAYIAKFRGIIDDLKTALPGVRLVVDTITERHAADGGADGSGGLNDKFNAWRKNLNALIRQWKADGVIAQVVDIGGDATLGANGAMQPNSTISADGLHLTEGAAPAGHGIATTIYAAAMNAVYAATPVPSGSSGTPTPTPAPTPTPTPAASPVAPGVVYSQDASPGFGSNFAFNQITPTVAGEFIFLIYSFGGNRQPGSFVFNDGSADIAAAKLATDGNLSLWHASLAAKAYTPKVTSAEAGFAHLTILGLNARNATNTPGHVQTLVGGNFNPPVSFPSAQTVGSGDLGFAFYYTDAALNALTFNEGVTKRGSILSNDADYGGVRNLSVVTFDTTLNPTVTGNSTGAAYQGFAVTGEKA